jgi:hypothetical protein
MYHTAFSRLSRKEIESMIKLVKKFDKKGKYSGMRLLPHSIKAIQEALERAKEGKFNLGAGNESTKSKNTSVSRQESESNISGYSPYGKWVNAIQRSQGLNTSIKDKYMSGSEDAAEELKNQQMKKKQDLLNKKQNKMKKDYEEAMRLNNQIMRDYMDRQKISREKSTRSIEDTSLLDQVKKAISKKRNTGIYFKVLSFSQ